MTLNRRNFLCFGASVAACGSLTRATHAQTFPSRPLTLVVPYAAGGSADTLPRIIAERMRTTLGQPIIVENVTGAAGNIGTGRVARAAADGYTFGLGTWSTHVANGAVYQLQYDVLNDFEPIAQIAFTPLMIATRKSLPVDSLKELIAWLKANPDKTSQATNGPGSVMHLAGVLFQRETATNFRFVPYRGAAPAIQDLLGGRIDFYIGLPADILPHARAGTIRVLAVTAKERMAVTGDTPTADEAGASGFIVSAWFGFWAPRGTPKHVITRLNSAIVDALADRAVRTRLEQDMNLEISTPALQTAEGLRAFQVAEIEKWWPIIRAAKIKAN
jgi:tripartite-type tricarboxylate transporter receptor subunit TctC